MHQVLKCPNDVRPDRVLLVVADQPAQVRLVLEDAEMVQPEPHHLFLQLRGRIDRAQQVAARGLVGELVAALIQRLARLRPCHRPPGIALMRWCSALTASNRLRRIEVCDLHGIDCGPTGPRRPVSRAAAARRGIPRDLALKSAESVAPSRCRRSRAPARRRAAAQRPHGRPHRRAGRVAGAGAQHRQPPAAATRSSLQAPCGFHLHSIATNQHPLSATRDAPHGLRAGPKLEYP